MIRKSLNHFNTTKKKYRRGNGANKSKEHSESIKKGQPSASASRDANFDVH